MLIKDNETLKNILSAIQKNVSFDSWKTYILTAELSYILPLLGKSQYELLQSHYDNDNLSTKEQELLPCIQACVAHYAMYLITPFLVLKVGENGIVQEQSQETSVARISDVQNLRTEAIKIADFWAEFFVEFLENNKSDFPLWVSGEGFTNNYELLIQDSRDLSKYINIIQNSRRAYLRLQNEIRNCEKLYIERVISKELLLEIKTQIKNGNLTTLNRTVFEQCQAALAFISMYEALPSMSGHITAEGFFSFVALDMSKKELQLSQEKTTFLMQKYKTNADTYMADLKAYLNENANSYPLYKSSSIYEPLPTVEETCKYNHNNGAIFSV